MIDDKKCSYRKVDLLHDVVCISVNITYVVYCSVFLWLWKDISGIMLINLSLSIGMGCMVLVLVNVFVCIIGKFGRYNGNYFTLNAGHYHR